MSRTAAPKFAPVISTLRLNDFTSAVSLARFNAWAAEVSNAQSGTVRVATGSAHTLRSRLTLEEIASGFTEGSVIFAAPGGSLAQDNAQFFFDDVNNRLAIGSAAPSTHLHVTAAAVVGSETIARFDVSDDAVGNLQLKNIHTGAGVFGPTFYGRGNSTNLPLGLIGEATTDSGTNPALLLDGRTAVPGALATRDVLHVRNFGTTYLALTAAGNVRVTNLTASRLVATDANKDLVSTITSANVAASVSDETGSGLLVFNTSPTIATSATFSFLTAGSVLFAGTAGLLSQDNANFFWDDSANRLRLGPRTSADWDAAYLTPAQHTAFALNDQRLAFVAIAENSTAGNNIVGGYGVVGSTNTSGTRLFAAGFEGDAYHYAAGTVTDLAGVSSFAETDAGTVTNMIGMYVQTNARSAGTVTNNFGILVNNQAGVGTNNWAIKTGTGQVQFGDVLQLAGGVTVAGLPATPAVGMIQRVTNALAPAWGVAVAGGGAAAALVWYNGAAWTVIGV